MGNTISVREITNGEYAEVFTWVSSKSNSFKKRGLCTNEGQAVGEATICAKISKICE